MTRLNLGCGRDIREGWINIDNQPLPGVDLFTDFDDKPQLPFDDDTVDHSEGSHILEHLEHPLPFMAELWRVTKPGGTAEFHCPYGSSDDADEDPTHVRRMYLGSWRYYSQPAYTRASYGYNADWQPETITLIVHPEFADAPPREIATMVRFQRNIVAEMRAVLRCVKPARLPLAELAADPELKIAVKG